jgi:DNA-binding HxlR family transcriptional regulator
MGTEHQGSLDGDLAGPQRAEHRAGGRVLSLFVPSLTLPVLRALEVGPMRLAELRQRVGLPAQTTLRGHLANLVEVGAIGKRIQPGSRYAMDYELTPFGGDLLEVADSLEAWLRMAPDGEIGLESGTAKGAVRALIDGWGSRMMRALSARSLSLTELDKLISDLNYPALERRLASMRMAGLVEARQAVGARTPYGVTEWGRRSIVPLAKATRCERIHLSELTAAPTSIDIETAFLLATPLAALGDTAGGWCQLQVERATADGGPAGVRVDVEAGRVVSCVSRLDPKPRIWAAGTARRWFDAIDGGDPSRLRFGGGGRLAESLIQSLHMALGSGGAAAGGLASGLFADEGDQQLEGQFRQ